MINIREVEETNAMIEKENLDVRTITLGISLLDCIDSDLDKVNANILIYLLFFFIVCPLKITFKKIIVFFIFSIIEKFI